MNMYLLFGECQHALVLSCTEQKIKELKQAYEMLVKTNQAQEKLCYASNF